MAKQDRLIQTRKRLTRGEQAEQHRGQREIRQRSDGTGPDRVAKRRGQEADDLFSVDLTDRISNFIVYPSEIDTSGVSG